MTGADVAASYHPVPYAFERYEPDEMRDRARSWHAEMDRRRSVRQFSTDPVPRGLIAERHPHRRHRAVRCTHTALDVRGRR